MPFCRHCNIEYDEGKKFCKKCGTPLTDQKKRGQEEAGTHQIPSESSRISTKESIEMEKSFFRRILEKQKINKYLVILYFITAGLYFIQIILCFLLDFGILFFSHFILFAIIIGSGFLLWKFKPSHWAIHVIFILLLLYSIVNYVSVLWICLDFY